MKTFKAISSKFFAGFLIVSLILTLFNGANIYAAPGDSRSYASANEQIQNKINGKLKDELKSNKEVTFLVKLKQQVDVSKVSKDADNKSKAENLSSATAKIVKRSSIVSELEVKSQETQLNLIKYLDAEKSKGSVKSYKSFYIVNGLEVTATEEVAEKLAAFQEVDKILPNEVRKLDPIIKTKISSKANTSSVEWNINKIGACSAWNSGINGTGVVVASIDTGVQWNHPALKTKYRGYNPADPDHPNNEFNWFDATAGQNTPYDDIGHGTHTMGTIVGSDPSGENQIGVAPGARWISVKAFTADGGTDADLIEAGQWILAPTDTKGTPHPEKAPDIVNNSWGGGAGLDEWYRQIVQAWRSANIFPEFSAGNVTNTNPGGPGSIANPANYPESFATGATDINDNLASFSLRGPSPYNEVKPEASAPGVNIRSSVPGSKYEGGWSGTSMAGPHVCGVAALLLQINSSLTVDQLEKIITSTAVARTDSEYPTSPNNGYGSGRIDAYAAVSSLLTGIGTVNGQVLKNGSDKTLSTIDDFKITDKLNNNNSSKSNTSVDTKASSVSKQAGRPLDAKVSVLETGVSVNTNPADGSYSLKNGAGKYTLKAETYGFYSENQSVNIVKDSTVTANFVLKEIPKGRVFGQIQNSDTKKAIKDAKVYVLEDAAVTPVKTDSNGNFTLNVYEGNYTLIVLAADYYSARIPIKVVGSKEIRQDLKLNPYIGYEGEISYDDGTAENAHSFYDAGNGWAVKFSLPKGKSTGYVTSGLFKFWDTSWPTPGGTSFKVAIYDASGTNGAPGKQLAGPINATAKRDGTWTKVDLLDQGVIVNGDFYIVYIQDAPNPNAPGLATDEDGPNAYRSWQFVNGSWTQVSKTEGNYLIRAIVKYAAVPPTIRTPSNNTFTNNAAVKIEGTAAPGLTVHLLNNGKEIAAVPANTDGKFLFDVKLNKGKNTFKAFSSAENGNTPFSSETNVTLDQTNPVLTITSPENGLKTNKEAYTITGTAVDENINYVNVNGNKAVINLDGTYSSRILLNEGENVINVTAVDKAGNFTSKSVSVYAKFNAPVINNLKPDKDKTLVTGQAVKIEFDSEKELQQATFTIHIPLVITGNKSVYEYSVITLPLYEVKDGNGKGTGHYEAYWTATYKLKTSGAEIEVFAKDAYGNESHQISKGKLFIN